MRFYSKIFKVRLDIYIYILKFLGTIISLNFNLQTSCNQYIIFFLVLSNNGHWSAFFNVARKGIDFISFARYVPLFAVHPAMWRSCPSLWRLFWRTASFDQLSPVSSKWGPTTPCPFRAHWTRWSSGHVLFTYRLQRCQKLQVKLFFIYLFDWWLEI